MRLFTSRKSTLLFVIRDKTKVCIRFFLFTSPYVKFMKNLILFYYLNQTPLDVLERILREDVQKVRLHEVTLYGRSKSSNFQMALNN